MNDDTTKQKVDLAELDTDDMLPEYDFSNAKRGKHAGAFKDRYIRVFEDGTEQVIKLKPRKDSLTVEPSQRQMSLLLDAFIVEYFEAKAGEQGVQALINQVLAEYIHNLDRQRQN
jgi:uncharacterized protein (DUF4415 family)